MRCFRCSKQAKINLLYLEKGLCDTCFCKLIEKRISKTIRLNKLIKPTDKVAVALSGGKDSVTLLNFLVSYAKEHQGPELIAIYIDRGDDYSTISMMKASNAAEQLGVEFHAFNFEDAFNISMSDIIKLTSKLGTNRCSICGVFRRRLLDIKARELGCNKLATGHNLTDEAQSFLMNFIKGEPNNFLSLGPISLPKREGFIQRIKPLRAVPEDEIKRYADLKKYDYFDKTCPCRVGSFRYEVMHILTDIQKFRPGAEFSIVKMGDKILNLLRRDINGELAKCKKCGELSSAKLCRVCQYLELNNNIKTNN